MEHRGSKCDARLYDGYTACPQCEHCRKLSEIKPKPYMQCEREPGHKGRHRFKGVEWK